MNIKQERGVLINSFDYERLSADIYRKNVIVGDEIIRMYEVVMYRHGDVWSRYMHVSDSQLKQDIKDEAARIASEELC